MVTAAASHVASAVVILIRGHGSRLEVFWVKRSDAVSYMPGFRAFVGGTVLPDDAELEFEGDAPEDRILRACAVREAFEEAGVLLGVEPSPPAASLAEARTLLLAGEAQFSEIARERGWRPRAEALSYTSRWITPPFAPRRFETAFYVARLPAGQEPSVVPGELSEGEWIRPLVALEQWQQGRESFAAPILYTLIALAEGEERLAERLAEAPEAAARPVRRIELKWGIVLQPMKTRPLPPATHTNAYLVGEPEMALIDPGSDDPAELEALFELIGLLERDRRKLALILVTHHHPDHWAGVDAVRKRYGVRVACHPNAASQIGADFTLKDGDWVPLTPGVGDWTLKVLHTPGHSSDHLSFLQVRTGSLFTGDLIPGGTGSVIIDPPEGVMSDYLASLERLLGEPVEILFPGHGAPQGAAMKRIRGLIAHRLGREAKVLSALSSEPRSILDLVARAYQDTPRELWPYAERSLLAHLIKLETEGRAKREGAGWRGAGG